MPAGLSYFSASPLADPLLGVFSTFIFTWLDSQTVQVLLLPGEISLFQGDAVCYTEDYISFGVGRWRPNLISAIYKSVE